MTSPSSMIDCNFFIASVIKILRSPGVFLNIIFFIREAVNSTEINFIYFKFQILFFFNLATNRLKFN